MTQYQPQSGISCGMLGLAGTAGLAEVALRYRTGPLSTRGKLKTGRKGTGLKTGRYKAPASEGGRYMRHCHDTNYR